MRLPSGNVTFLFTDLEDSTRLWERHGKAMRDALLQHDAIMQAAIDDHGGVLIKHTGDGVYAVFPDARAAALACVTAQRALQAIAGEVALRSRMAFYTGEAELQGDDYRGTVLNRAARLMAAGHGGQVLVSQSAREQIGEALPEGLQLRDLGRRRLKDVSGTEQVFQLVVEGLPSDFPPLRTQDKRKLDVPAPTSPIVGREHELGAIAEAFRGGATRLVTLTGPGGTGKSRLAIELARRLVDDFHDGAVFVPLAAVVDVNMVLPAIARALDVREDAGDNLDAALCQAVRDKHLLLVLDNFEQIMEAAPLVRRLLEAAARLCVLVTSREALRVSGEHEHAVASLCKVDAVELFIARAQDVKPDVRLDDASVRDIAEICLRVDGLPLAIELAAARVRILTPSLIKAALGDSLGFLAGGARDAPDRHRTLRATIDWSHALLAADEQALFRGLGVFAGGASLDAVQQVCGVDGEPAIVDTLESLVAKSLVRQIEWHEAPRFAMLETIHEYARERLAAATEADALESSHAEYFACLAEESQRSMNTPQQAEWLDRLEVEHPNLRTALAYGASARGVAWGYRLCKALHRFWASRGHITEGRRWCSRLLQASEDALDADARAEVLHVFAGLALLQQDYDVAAPILEQVVARARERGDLRRVGRALGNLGIIQENRGELASARRCYEESIAIKRAIGDRGGLFLTLGGLANVVLAEGDVDLARTLHREVVAGERELGTQENLAIGLANLGGVLVIGGELAQARRHYDESVAILRRLNGTSLLAQVLAAMADLELDAASPDAARRCCIESLGYAVDVGDRRTAVSALETLGIVAVAQRLPISVACPCFGAAARIRQEIKSPKAPRDQARLDACIAQARNLANEGEFEAAWEAGRRMTFDEAVAYALRMTSDDEGG